MALSERFIEISARVRNWGRWGDDDELGTLNLITEEAVRAAGDCIRTGKTFPLAVPLEADGIQVGFIPGRDNPTRTMIALNDPWNPTPTRTSSTPATTPYRWDSRPALTGTGSVTLPTEAGSTTGTRTPQ